MKDMIIVNYLFRGKAYPIRYLSDSLFKDIISTTQHSSIKKKLVRGITFFYPDGTWNIYIKNSAIIGRRLLVEHEIGHVLGFGHTWKPTTMNPSWLFRWFRWMKHV